MTDKELRKLKRAELLEILFYLQKENEELRSEVQSLKEQAEKRADAFLTEDFMKLMKQMIQEAVQAAQKPEKSDNSLPEKTEHSPEDAE